MAEYKQYYRERKRYLRIKVLLLLGGICKRCGFDDIRALHIDHVQGDGSQERGIRTTIYRKILLGEIDLRRYQVLCSNCNWIKIFENKEGTQCDDYNDFLARVVQEINDAPLRA